jgi:hypothetical protein
MYDGAFEGDMQYWNGNAWIMITAPTENAGSLSFCDGEPTWTQGECPVYFLNPAVIIEQVSVTNPDGSLDPDNIIDEVGDIINYRIIVSNVGFADLTNVAIDDPLIQFQVPPGDSTITGPFESQATDGILEPDETWMYSGSYSVTADDMSTDGDGNGQIENIATVTTDEFPPVTMEVETPIFYAVISGRVRDDTDGNYGYGAGLQSVRITLSKCDYGSCEVIATTETDYVGTYFFRRVEAGSYRVDQTNLAGYIDVSDSDGQDPNQISVNGGIRVRGGMTYPQNDFVDALIQ